MLAKMRMVFDQRGSHSFSELKRTGERLCNISTLVFCISSVTILRQHVEPLANLLQDADSTCWERLAALHGFCTKTGPLLQQSLRRARRFVKVALLIRPYLTKKDFGIFWLAHIIGSYAKQFVGLFSSMHDLLLDGSYRGCELLVSAVADPFVHPACQCISRRRMPGTHGLARGGGVLDPQGRTDARIRDRSCRIPLWVPATNLTQQQWKNLRDGKSPDAAPVNWHRCRDCPVLPASRLCRAPSRVVAASALFEAGLDASLSFVCTWIESLKEFPSRVCCAELWQIWENATEAFWLPAIFDAAEPCPRRLLAFDRLFQLLKPDLEHTLWPDDSWEWTPAVRKWPTVEGMRVLYKRWWSAVRTNRKEEWWRLQGYQVSLIAQPHGIFFVPSTSVTPAGKRKRADIVCAHAPGDEVTLKGGMFSGSVVRIISLVPWNALVFFSEALAGGSQATGLCV